MAATKGSRDQVEFMKNRVASKDEKIAEQKKAGEEFTAKIELLNKELKYCKKRYALLLRKSDESA